MRRLLKQPLVHALVAAGLSGCGGGSTDAADASGAPLPTVAEAGSTKAVAVFAWRHIGGESDTLSVPAGSTVRYGANGSYVLKAVSGTFQATNAFFGVDPAAGTRKSVELREAAQITETEVDRYLSSHDEVGEVVRGLEQQYDSFREAEAAGTSLLAGDGTLPTGEEIGRDFEAFLAELDDQSKDGDDSGAGWDGR